MDAIDEVIDVGREAQITVRISHLKLADRALWGTTDAVIAKLDEARARGVDIRADIYPYEHWASNLAILFPDRDYTDIAAAEFTFRHTAHAGDIVLAHYPPNPDFNGLSIADIATMTERDPETTLMQLALAADEHRGRTGTKRMSAYSHGGASPASARTAGHRFRIPAATVHFRGCSGAWSMNSSC